VPHWRRRDCRSAGGFFLTNIKKTTENRRRHVFYRCRQANGIVGALVEPVRSKSGVTNRCGSDVTITNYVCLSKTRCPTALLAKQIAKESKKRKIANQGANLTVPLLSGITGESSSRLLPKHRRDDARAARRPRF
jgi:hypothetical protein